MGSSRRANFWRPAGVVLCDLQTRAKRAPHRAPSRRLRGRPSRTERRGAVDGRGARLWAWRSVEPWGRCRPLGPPSSARWLNRHHRPNPQRPQAPPRPPNPSLRDSRGAFPSSWCGKAPAPLVTVRDRIPVTTVPRTLADIPSTLAPYLVRRAIRQAEFLKLPTGIETDRTRSDLERDFLPLVSPLSAPAPPRSTFRSAG